MGFRQAIVLSLFCRHFPVDFVPVGMVICQGGINLRQVRCP